MRFQLLRDLRPLQLLLELVELRFQDGHALHRLEDLALLGLDYSQLVLLRLVEVEVDRQCLRLAHYLDPPCPVISDPGADVGVASATAQPRIDHQLLLVPRLDIVEVLRTILEVCVVRRGALVVDVPCPQACAPRRFGAVLLLNRSGQIAQFSALLPEPVVATLGLQADLAGADLLLRVVLPHRQVAQELGPCPFVALVVLERPLLLPRLVLDGIPKDLQFRLS